VTTHDVTNQQLPGGAGDSGDVVALPAASVLLLREGPDGTEVLMLRRHAKSSFVPNAWVFPGGVTDPIDRELATELSGGSLLDTMRLTAVRELFEESGIWLGAELHDAATQRARLLAGSISLRELLAESPVFLDRLVWTSRWITPIGIPKRFDTYFFLAKAAPGAVATAEEVEAVEVLWIAPSEALRRHAGKELQMVFPTVKNLEAIDGLPSIAALLESRRGIEIPAIQPLLIVEGREKKLVLP
jgi:8-oxo-dGTP pyrophosphatase MutT (NUDIX family)